MRESPSGASSTMAGPRTRMDQPPGAVKVAPRAVRRGVSARKRVGTDAVPVDGVAASAGGLGGAGLAQPATASNDNTTERILLMARTSYAHESERRTSPIFGLPR